MNYMYFIGVSKESTKKCMKSVEKDCIARKCLVKCDCSDSSSVFEVALNRYDKGVCGRIAAGENYNLTRDTYSVYISWKLRL